MTFDTKLADQWRYSLATVEECEFFIKQAIRLGRDPTPYRVTKWREAIRTVSEAQEEMDRINMKYALSTDDWRYE